jgi:hypothetical protein
MIAGGRPHRPTSRRGVGKRRLHGADGCTAQGPVPWSCVLRTRFVPRRSVCGRPGSLGSSATRPRLSWGDRFPDLQFVLSGRRGRFMRGAGAQLRKQSRAPPLRGRIVRAHPLREGPAALGLQGVINALAGILVRAAVAADPQKRGIDARTVLARRRTRGGTRTCTIGPTGTARLSDWTVGPHVFVPDEAFRPPLGWRTSATFSQRPIRPREPPRQDVGGKEGFPKQCAKRQGRVRTVAACCGAGQKEARFRLSFRIDTVARPAAVVLDAGAKCFPHR